MNIDLCKSMFCCSLGWRPFSICPTILYCIVLLLCFLALSLFLHSLYSCPASTYVVLCYFCFFSCVAPWTWRSTVLFHCVWGWNDSKQVLDSTTWHAFLPSSGLPATPFASGSAIACAKCTHIQPGAISGYKKKHGSNRSVLEGSGWMLAQTQEPNKCLAALLTTAHIIARNNPQAGVKPSTPLGRSNYWILIGLSVLCWQTHSLLATAVRLHIFGIKNNSG